MENRKPYSSHGGSGDPAASAAPTVFLVTRHGETVWNVEDRICGRTDVPLTEKGLAQAEMLARELASARPDVIVCSPLQRARTTAEAVARVTGLPLRVDVRLAEQDFGRFEGVRRLDPDFVEAKMHFAMRHGTGESLLQTAHRAYSLLDRLREECRGQRVLLVCHGSMCRIIHTYFEEMDNSAYARFATENCQWREYALSD